MLFASLCQAYRLLKGMGNTAEFARAVCRTGDQLTVVLKLLANQDSIRRTAIEKLEENEELTHMHVMMSADIRFRVGNHALGLGKQRHLHAFRPSSVESSPF